MTGTARRRLPASTVALALLVAGLLHPARAQPAERGAVADTARPPGVTLATWEERVRLTIFDRGGAFDGRLSRRGILQRFHEDMDGEYDLDVLSSRFSLAEDRAWHRRRQGARFWAGSISHRRLIQRGQVKAAVDLDEAWTVGVRFDHARTLTARRNLVRLGAARELADGRGEVFLNTTLRAEKSEADLEAGYTWSPAAGEVTVAVGALDLFSDVVYQGLGVDPALADSALDYRAHPFTVRTAVDLRLGEGVRAEAYGLVMTPGRLEVESQGVSGSGFVQDEGYAYAGGLLEWRPDARTAVGGLATWVRARTERRSLEPGDPGDRLDLTEETWRAGLFAVRRFGERVSAEARLVRVRREEERVRAPAAPDPSLSYADRAWEGRADAVYRADNGVLAGLGLDVTLGAGSGRTDPRPLEPLARHDWRLRADLGYRVGGRALFVVGANHDLDGGGFDGAHGRFALYW